tara:strand:- start:743 stop:1462 length:720 start_codon:yes stop_codon:yes gene_type:complete
MKVFGLLMTYNCENLVDKAVSKIPISDLDKLICTDDGSSDNTVFRIKKKNIFVVENIHNGYGSNLFSGLSKAFEMGATHVIEIHGDGQYDYSKVVEMKKKFEAGADLVLGDRFYDYKQPLKDGMPWHIYIGNIVMSFTGRILLGLPNNDLFPGFRGYSKKFFLEMKRIDLPQDYRFSFDIIVRSVYKKLKIFSTPVRCDYKGEHHTAPIKTALPIIINLIYTGLAYRLRWLGLKKELFK